MPHGYDYINRVDPTLGRKIRENGYSLGSDDIDAVAKISPGLLILVRCGCGRFLTPADSVQHFIGIIHRSKDEYVRDVSFQAG